MASVDRVGLRDPLAHGPEPEPHGVHYKPEAEKDTNPKALTAGGPLEGG